MMARIEYSDPAKANDRTARSSARPQRNIFRMMRIRRAISSSIAGSAARSATRGELDPIVRELAITRTGILSRRRMKSSRTSGSARMSASPNEQNEALENWQQATCFDEVQRAALAFADEIVKSAEADGCGPSTRSRQS